LVWLLLLAVITSHFDLSWSQEDINKNLKFNIFSLFECLFMRKFGAKVFQGEFSYLLASSNSQKYGAYKGWMFAFLVYF
jgi:hypothetical protein